MRLGEESIVIRRPLDTVFSFVADTTNDPRWHTTVVEGQRTSAGPVGLGTTFEGIYDSKKRTLDAPAHAANFNTSGRSSPSTRRTNRCASGWSSRIRRGASGHECWGGVSS